jgi:CHAT domain-containing protein/tetratricopeptide (TPR) repeat protein
MRPIDGRPGDRGSWILIAVLAYATSSPAAPQAPKEGAASAQADSRAERLERQAAYRKQMEEFNRRGMSAPAIEATNRFMELERELAGENTPGMLVALRQLADIAVRDRKDAEALGHLRKALEVERRLHGDDHWHVTDMRDEIAYVEAVSKLGAEERQRLVAASSAQSLEELRRGLLVLRRSVGEHTFRYVLAQEKVAWTLRAGGNPFAAAVWAERWLVAAERLVGRRHPSYLRALRLRGLLHHDLGEETEALRAIEEAAAIARGIPDLDRRESLALAEDLGIVRGASGDLEGAARAYADAARLALESGGEGSPDHIRLLAEEADLARRRRDFGTARTLWDRVLAHRKPKDGKDILAYAFALTQAARSLQDQGDLDGAMRLVREVGDLRKGHPELGFGGSAVPIERNLTILGDRERESRRAEIQRLAAREEELRRREELEQVIPVLKSQVELTRTAIDGDESDLAIHPLERLARVSLQRGDFSAARQAREQRKDILESRLSDDHWQSVDARLALGQIDSIRRLDANRRHRLAEVGTLRARATLLAFLGRYGAGSDDLRRAQALQAELLGEDDPDALDLLAELGMSLFLQGRGAEAEAIATRLLVLNRRVRGPRHPATVSAAVLLARARKARGDVRGARDALLRVAEAKRPPQDVPGSTYTRYHANSQLAGLARDREALEAVPRRGGGSSTDHDIASLRALAEAERDILGIAHPARLESLECLARRQRARHQYEGAIAARREVVRFHLERSGPDGWGTVDARANLAELERMAAVAREDPDLLRAAEFADLGTFSARSPGSSPGRDQGETRSNVVSALVLWRRILGERAPRCVRDLENIGTTLREQGQFDAAERVLARVADLRRLTVGEGHPAHAQALHELGQVLLDQGRAAEAEAMLRRAVRELEQKIGRTHPATGTTLLDWGRALRAVGDLEGARRACQDGAAILQAGLGERHLAYQMAVVELATALQLRGDYPGALSLLEAIQRRLGPAGFLNGAAKMLADTCATDLAGLLARRGELARAKVLLEGHLEERRSRSAPPVLSTVDRRGYESDVGEGRFHPAHAEHLHTLADVLMELGDSARADLLYGEALELTEELLGPDHPSMAERRVGLARALVARGEAARAEEILARVERDVEIRGERDTLRPLWLSTSAAARAARNQPGEAAVLWERSLAASARVFGEGHPEHVRRLNDLAEFRMARGDFAGARTNLERGLALNQGRAWSDTFTEGILLLNLARASLRTGDPTRARDLYRKALSIREAHLAHNLPALGERERLVLVARFRDPFLESLDLIKGDAALDREAFGHLVAWKGIATAGARREGRSLSRREAVFLTYPGDFRMISARLREVLVGKCYERFAMSPYLRRTDDVSNDPRLLRAIEGEQARVEGERANDVSANGLGAIVQEIGTVEAIAAGSAVEPQPPPHPDRICAAVPARSVLLDFICYVPHGSEPRYAVFAVPHGGPPRRFELGAAAPIDRAVRAWLAAIESDSDDWVESREVYGRLWAPVADLCRESRTVLVSPDGELNHLPWAALPDLSPAAAPGAFLLERHAFAQMASARRLVEGARPPTGTRGLLAVGGVDYQRRSPRRAGWMPFPFWGTLGPSSLAGPPLLKMSPLPGTAKELKDVRDLYAATSDRSGPAITLSGPMAEKVRVKSAMVGMRYILLATHGFFDPPEIREALAFEDGRPAIRSPSALSRAEATALYPGLLSGLMMAGVNEPPRADHSTCRLDWGAGLLTAEEVAALDLDDCELAVLSACETGLGRVAGGEGMLGLQRAFHVAGARFVVASLWRVGDRATRWLMSLFFENVWARRLSPPEAMRQAQLTLLREGHSAGDVRGLGRLVPSEARKDGGPGPASRRLHPCLWAAWVVSGVPDEPGAPAASTDVPASGPPATRPAGRPDRGEAPEGAGDLPPGWLGGKLEPFLAVSIDPTAGDALTTAADGTLRRYDYPEFKPRGSFRLAGPAYHALHEDRRGLLFAFVTRSNALKIDKVEGEPSGAGDLHVYDIRRLRDGRLAEGSRLVPAAIVPIGANLPRMLASRDGSRIFGLERDPSPGGAATLVRVDTTLNKVDLEFRLPAGAETLCMTPDGSALYAGVSTRRTGIPNGSGHGEGELLDIDPNTMRIRSNTRIPLHPVDIQAGDRGLVFIIGGSEKRSDGIIAVVDMRGTPRVVGQWPLHRRESRMRLSGDERWLFLSPRRSTPPLVDAWLIPPNFAIKPTVIETLMDSVEIPLGGELFLSPSGDYLLSRAGGVVPIRVRGDRR